MRSEPYAGIIFCFIVTKIVNYVGGIKRVTHNLDVPVVFVLLNQEKQSLFLDLFATLQSEKIPITRYWFKAYTIIIV